VTDILSLIDGAIEDWETSEDAMRWTPEPPARQAEPSYTIIDETHVWTGEMARAFGELIDRAAHEMQPTSIGQALTPLQVARAADVLATPLAELSRSGGSELSPWQRWFLDVGAS
jgi:hypothetical protein